jgi:3-oxosteroid 1-dehydrogenase
MPAWDHVTDFLVVGSGGGLVGAVAARAAGLDVLVAEGTERLGGSTCMSGGILWLPGNPLMRRDGLPDSEEAALDYFADVVGDAGPASSEARRRAYLTSGSAMIEFLEQEGMEFVRCEGYSDYYAEMSGIRGGSVRGRAIECVATDTNRIGPLADRIHPSYASPMVVLTGEVAKLTLPRSKHGAARMARVLARTALGRLRGERLTSNGAALITQLLEVLLRREVPIWTESPVTDLIEKDGRVVGAVVRRDGRDQRVLARRGVLLASGGFAHNTEMRRRYSGEQPNDGRWSHSNPGDTGEALQTAIELRAATDMLDEAWWLPTIIGPEGDKYMIVQERSRPGSIIVDGSGRRYFNEAISYVEAGRQMYKREREAGGGVPSWLILDSRHRSQYLLGPMGPMLTSKEWLKSGRLKKAGSIVGLAAQCKIAPAVLTTTVERFNRFAETGLDEDFHRGQGAHERYQGDYRWKPNASLGPLTTGPFYATEIYPGDVGTCGGLLANEHAQVLNTDGHVIDGLYAAGNVTASVMGRTYPGPGASIGASTVFSFVAANHAARRARLTSPAPDGETIAAGTTA